uniref:Uncharacterized protein n=1 Tax=Daphnia magna TaxID=35525 RepID=A0A0P6JCF1_9CRUS
MRTGKYRFKSSRSPSFHWIACVYPALCSVVPSVIRRQPKKWFLSPQRTRSSSGMCPLADSNHWHLLKNKRLKDSLLIQPIRASNVLSQSHMPKHE